MAQRLNERFTNAEPSSVLARAGVMVHELDGQATDPERPWLPCPPTCGDSNATECMCDRWRDRMSVSMLSGHGHSTNRYGGKIATWDHRKEAARRGTPSGVGFVLEPAHTEGTMLCAYDRDVGTGALLCTPPGVSSTCLPGCVADSWCMPIAWSSSAEGDHGTPLLATAAAQYLRQNPSPAVDPPSCSWRPADLDFVIALQEANSNVLRRPYNELIIDVDAWLQRLPSALEAIFYHCESDATARSVANTMQRALNRTYGVAVPILGLNRHDWREPFTARASSGC